MNVLDYLPKSIRDLGLASGAYVLRIFHKNIPYLILYQRTKFQCHTFFSSQDIK